MQYNKAVTQGTDWYNEMHFDEFLWVKYYYRGAYKQEGNR